MQLKEKLAAEVGAGSRPSSSRARGSTGPSTAVTPSRTKSTPSPATTSRTPQTPSMLSPASAEPRTPQSSLKGKRKADEVDGSNGNNITPPDVRKQRATFAADPRPNRLSGTSSQAPSSYTRKRARLSAGASSVVSERTGAIDKDAAVGSRPPSRSDSQRHAGNTGTASSRGSPSTVPFRTQSRVSQTSQHHSIQVPSRAASTSRHQGQSKSGYPPPQSGSRAPSRRGSISQASIPISALISPHAPSISTRAAATQFHMRDPRKPRIQPTPWTLTLPQIGPGERLSSFDRLKLGKRIRGDEEQQELHSVGWTESGGSPLHAWLFFIGFIIFPVWWVAAILGIPRTRRIGGLEGGQDEKKMALDDPQVEHDANSWRKRCRVMAIVSVFTYIPFIVLVAIFA